MPVKVTDQGWVKMPPQVKPSKSAKKAADPVGILRGPLAYITGRPGFKQPVKKQSMKQLMIEAARAPPIQPYIEERAPRTHREHRSKRIPSEPVPRRRNSYEEADEEIPRFIPDDLQSRRSASPVGTRRGGAAPSVRSRKDPRPQSVYDDGYEVEPKSRSRRHVSSSVYGEPVRSSNRHSYHRERDVERYSPPQREREVERYTLPQQSYRHSMAPQTTLQPIIIYSTPPNMGGCGGGHHGCHSGMYQQQFQPQHQCYTTPHPMLQMASMAATIEAPPMPAASVFSSASSSSKASRPMSTKWYGATQPLKI